MKTTLFVFLQRWLKQALEEEGSTSPARRPSFVMPCEGPLSPSINGESDSPLPYNGTCSTPGSVGQPAIANSPAPPSPTDCLCLLPLFSSSNSLAELPTPLKKRRLSPLDACMSESSTPYGSPCATPTRVEQSEAPATPVLMATPPRPRGEEPSVEPMPCTPVQTLGAPPEVSLDFREVAAVGALIDLLID